jgi:hypothetical protein
MHVRIARGDVSAQPWHATGHDACDLPDLHAVVRHPWLSAGCCWEFFYTGAGYCPCSNCHGGWQARVRNRAERHRDRAALSKALGAWRAGDSTAFDSLVPPSRLQ